MMFEIASEARGITVGKIVALFLYHLAAPSAPSEQVASRHASYRPCAGSCGEGTRHVLSVWHAPSAIHLVATTRAFARSPLNVNDASGANAWLQRMP
jgi:hypothetical protein